MDDFVVNVKQIGNYPPIDFIAPNDLILVQQGGLGGPYRSATQRQYLNSVGLRPPPDAKGLIANYLITPNGQRQGYNFYVDTNGQYRSLQGGPIGMWEFDGRALSFAINAASSKDSIVASNLWQTLFHLSAEGKLDLFQQVGVGRDPAADNELVTLRFLRRFVRQHQVQSWNGRSGNVCLTVQDINDALMLAAGNSIADQCWVSNFIDCWYYNTFTGPDATAQATTADPGDSSNRIATTAYVMAAINLLQTMLQQQLEQMLNDALASVNYAPLHSPHFTGFPTAPTAPLGSSSGQLATTAFVMNAITQSVAGVASWNGQTGAVTFGAAELAAMGAFNNVELTGVPTAPTAAAGTWTDQVASTAFVMAALNALAITGGVTSFNGRTGVITLTLPDIVQAGGASQDFVASAIATAMVNCVTSFNGRTGLVSLQGNDISAAGGALLAGPALTGTPTAPTASPGTSNTQLATTAFVNNAIAAGAVSSFNGRTGPVTLTQADIIAAGGGVAAGNRVELVRQVVSSAQSTVQIWWVFDGTYDQYELEAYEVMFSSTSPGGLFLQVSTDGSSFANTGYSHGYLSNGGWSSGIGPSGPIGPTSAQIAPRAGNSALTMAAPGYVVAGQAMVFKLKTSMPQKPNSFKVFRWDGAWPESAGSMSGGVMIGAGTAAESPNPLRGLRFSLGTGNFTSGVFVLYGIAKP